MDFRSVPVADEAGQHPLQHESSSDGHRRGGSWLEMLAQTSQELSNAFSSITRRSEYEQLPHVDSPIPRDDEENASAQEEVHNVICSNGRSIVDVIRNGDLEVAKAAFVAAAERKQLVKLRDDEGRDVLGIAVKQKNYEATRLVLENLANKCTSVKETARILTDNILDLDKFFPELLKEFIGKNKFCFEVGRFLVPTSVFSSNRGLIIATSDMLPVDWSSSEDETRQLWRSMHRESDRALRNASTATTAVVKFVPIEDIAKSRMGRIVQSLLVGRAPLDAFKSKLIKWLVHWKWNEIWRWWFCMFLLLNVFLVLCFSVFVISCHANEESWYPNDSQLLIVSYYICICLLVLEAVLLVNYVWGHRLKGLLYFLSSPWNWLKVICGVCMVVWVYPSLQHRFSDIGLPFLFSFLPEELSISLAVEAILVWTLMLYSAQPFKYTGPLVATVQAVLVDIIPFLALGLVVLVGFSIGAYALDSSGSAALLRTMQDLFYALLGDFNHFTGGDKLVGETSYNMSGTLYIEENNSSRYGALSTNTASHLELEPDAIQDTLPEEILTHGFLDIFILLEGIVLLTLLFAIMNDTHDKVKMNTKAHLTRSRAMIVYDCEATFYDWLRKRIERKTKKYLYVLKPVEKMSFTFGPNWQGKLKRTEKMIKRLLQDTKNEQQSDLDEIKMRLSSLEGLETHLSRLEGLETHLSRLEGLETKLEILIQKLQPHDRADS